MILERILMLRWFFCQLSFFEKGRRHLFVLVEFEVTRQRIPGFMGTCETDFEEEWFVALVIVDPGHSRIADKDVAVKVLVQMPGDTLVLFHPIWIRLVAVIGTLLTMQGEVTSPVVIGSTLEMGATRRILDDDPFVEATRHVVWVKCILPILTHQ